jgi:hypothetical protein
LLDPSQFSATSQPCEPSATPRQTTLAETTPSGGQSLVTPLQLSATSHVPLAARHWAVLLASAGQTLLVPSQRSSTSQSPAEPRHTVVDGSIASAGQLISVVPLQVSETSHSSVTNAARHTVPAGSRLIAQEPALQVSGLSQSVLLPLPHSVPLLAT